MREALHDFIETIEATGGCVRDEGNTGRPGRGPDWLDLADVYLRACKVLGREPRIRLPMTKRSSTRVKIQAILIPTRPATTMRATFEPPATTRSAEPSNADGLTS